MRPPDFSKRRCQTTNTAMPTPASGKGPAWLRAGSWDHTLSPCPDGAAARHATGEWPTPPRGCCAKKVKDVDGFAQSAVQKHAPFFGQVRLGLKGGSCQVKGHDHQQPFGYPVNPVYRALLKNPSSGMPVTAAHDTLRNGSRRSRFFKGQTASDVSAFRPP